MKIPELLLPAGTLKHLDYAFYYGADAVYAGQPRYSLRARNNDFDESTILHGIQKAHQAGKQFFLASNVIPHNSKVCTYLDDLAPLVEIDKDARPDALIMADPGLIMLVREKWPDIPVHLSVQANTVNYAAVQFWQKIGITRVILSRELGLDEIAEIRQQCPDIELEVFVHGALCIAYSGRCLLSGYFNHRDPNQGTCTNACRWEYQLRPAAQTISGDIKPLVPGQAFDPFDEIEHPPLFEDTKIMRHPLADQAWLLEEKERPGELMPIFEDDNGTYIMNSRDLRALEHVGRLMQIGVDSLKVEGRTKSHYYVARTAQVYRRAIDDIAAGKELDPRLFADLNNLANRGYTDGFYQRHHSHEYQNYLDNHSRSKQQQFVAEVIEYDADRQMALLDVKNKFCRGDELEVILPKKNLSYRLEQIYNEEGTAIEVAPGSGHKVWAPVPCAVNEMTLIARNNE